MIEFPRNTSSIHRFEVNRCKYVVDLQVGQILEIDEVIWDILDICSLHTTQEIIELLKREYNESLIVDALELLESARQGCLIFMSQPPTPKRDVPKILIAAPSTIYRDITHVSGGAVISSHYIIKALSEYLDVHLLDREERQLDEHIYGVRIDTTDPFAVYLRFAQEEYLGVFSRNPCDHSILPALDAIQVPFLVRIFSPRGQCGIMVNDILMWHAAMRPFDGFIVPSQYVKDFYAQFVSVNNFHVVQNGVDHDLFRPMDKQQAKSEVARRLNRSDISEKPIVGFLSRFQPEKGSNQYVRAAIMNPEFLFLVVAPEISAYGHRDLPDNVIYAGPQERQELPLFFNAFDVHCFPSITGEEAFGNAVMEAMACGTPPVVPDFGPLPEVVGDAGVVVPAETYASEIGSIAGWVSAHALSDSIRSIIVNDEWRKRLAKRALEHAQKFTWSKTARLYLSLFQQLKQRTNLYKRRHLMVSFSPYIPVAGKDIRYRAFLFDETDFDEHISYFTNYPQTVEEGLALSLYRRHRPGEVEALLKHVCLDSEEAQDIAERTQHFLDSIS